MNKQIPTPPKNEKSSLLAKLEKLGRNLLLSDNSKQKEYNFSWKHLSSCGRVLDIGCGVGLFLDYAPERILGIDINPHSIDFCKSKGLQALVGDALKLEFPDNSFDGVHSSHLMHVFNAGQAMTFVKEMCVTSGRTLKTAAHIHLRCFMGCQCSRLLQTSQGSIPCGKIHPNSNLLISTTGDPRFITL
jgi:SAM-dependent methyltransferase